MELRAFERRRRCGWKENIYSEVPNFENRTTFEQNWKPLIFSMLRVGSSIAESFRNDRLVTLGTMSHHTEEQVRGTHMSLLRWSTRVFWLVCAAALSSSASAQTLWVGAVTGTNSFNFSPTFFNNEGTNLGTSPNQVAFYDHSATDTFKQLDLIVVVPNAAASLTITGVNSYVNVGNVNGSNNISGVTPSSTKLTSISPFASATYSNGSSQDAYTAIGTGAKGQGTPSENFSNFSGAEASIGINATSFYEYEYNLNSFAGGFGDYGLLDITFSGALPKGAIVIGWGCGSKYGCTPQYNSVFTQSGVVGGNSQSAVPEPLSIFLLGTVALVAVGIGKTRKTRKLNT